MESITAESSDYRQTNLHVDLHGAHSGEAVFRTTCLAAGEQSVTSCNKCDLATQSHRVWLHIAANLHLDLHLERQTTGKDRRSNAEIPFYLDFIWIPFGDLSRSLLPIWQTKRLGISMSGEPEHFPAVERVPPTKLSWARRPNPIPWHRVVCHSNSSEIV